MRSDIVLAFDFGLKYTGVAVGQTITKTAKGATTLRCKDGQPRWHEVATLVERYTPRKLIVGLPLNMDGSDSDMSARAREFAAKLGNRFNLDVDLQDERLTSRSAQDGLTEAIQQGLVKTDHELAAVIIAEDWLRSLT